MHRGRRAHPLTHAALLLLIPVTTLAQSNCSEVINEIDRRIESGEYSTERVQYAKLLQAAIAQTCDRLTESARAGLMG